MYHLRLIKGLSYCGLVEASKIQPDVFVEDKAVADAALASGYFELLACAKSEQSVAHLDKAQLKTMDLEELKKLAADLGLDSTNLKKTQLVDAIADIEVAPGYGEGE